MAEGKVKGFFKNIGNKINEVQLESDIKSVFNKANKEFAVYSGANVLSFGTGFCAEDHIEEGYVVALTNDEFDDKYLIEDKVTKKVYYIVSIEETTVTVTVEGEPYERKAKKITLGSEAEKVDAIKVGDSYYKAK